MAKEFWTFDCESDPFKFGRVPKPFLWGFYNPEFGYFEFKKTSDAINFMKNRDAIFYAHNGGKFDFHFIADDLTRMKKILLMHNRLVQAKLGKAEIRDSYSLLPFALKQYNKKEIEYWKLEKEHRKKHMPEIKEYLKSDCVYLYELIEAFFTEHGRHLTAAGAAIKTLAKMEGLKIENSGSMFFAELQKYYFGGRCECLRSGEYHDKITYLDINSAYPFAMLHKHPIGTEYKETYLSKPKIKAENFYTIEAKSYGAFCRREKGGLKFDWDGVPRTYHTTGHELIAAIETGKAKIIKHIKQIEFEETKSFEKFVWHFWNIRQSFSKGTTDNLFAKLFLNSAYGKFCANPENYETFLFADPAISEWLISEDWEIRGELGKHILVSRPIDEEHMRYYNVATGASITGFVRAMLMKALANVKNPIYCDTDSLIFTGKTTLPLSDELGQWKIEGEFTEGFFAGKKLYGVRNKKEEPKIASKGGRLSYQNIKDITRGKTVEFNQDAPSFSWHKKETGFLTRKIKKTA